MKKIFRVSTALFLCFVMLLYTGPMQVAASGLAGALYQIAGNIGVNAALRAIGVGPGNSPDVFNTLVTNISDALAPVSNFMTDVLIAGTSGNWLTFLRDTFLQSILDYLVDNGVVSASAVSSLDVSFNGSQISVEALDSSTGSPIAVTYNCYHFYVSGTGDYYYSLVASSSQAFRIRWSFSGGSINVTSAKVPSGGSSYTAGFGPSYSSKTDTPPSSNSVSVVELGSFATYAAASLAISNYNGGSFNSSQDLTVDSFSPSLDDDPYIPWVENSIFNNGETFVPVSLPSLDSSVVSSQTQTQAQAGTATDAVVDEIIAGSEVVPDTGTGTIADVIAAIKAIPASLADFFADVVAAVQAIPAAIADIFSPAADPEVYQVDLKDFFPFCIPFDLFDIVTAFAAEPEAPVFEWPISVPRWGFEYTLKVDLQEWEDIASLFRTLELTIFCVGLAIVTREKFLRS